MAVTKNLLEGSMQPFVAFPPCPIFHHSPPENLVAVWILTCRKRLKVTLWRVGGNESRFNDSSTVGKIYDTSNAGLFNRLDHQKTFSPMLSPTQIGICKHLHYLMLRRLFLMNGLDVFFSWFFGEISHVILEESRYLQGTFSNRSGGIVKHIFNPETSEIYNK